MTIPENNANSSSSPTASEMNDAISAFENLAPLKLILSYMKEGGTGNKGPRRYLIGNEDDDDDADDDDDGKSSPDEKEGTTIFNPIIVNDDLWNPRNVDWTLHGKKLEPVETTKHEPSSDSLLPPSQGDVYDPSSSDVSSDDDAISNASDIACGSGVVVALDTVVNEEDVKERSNKAAFAQELIMSTLFSE